MRDKDKTKEQLIDELVEMRQRIGELEASVTQRRQAEEALRESEAKYSAVVEKARDGVFIIQDGLLKFANAALSEIAGYSVQEVLDEPFMDLLVSESRDVVAERYKSRLAGEEIPPVYEITIQCKDETIKETEISAGIIQYQGRPATVVVMRDITERKRAEEALRDSEQKYRHLFENLNDAAFLADVETGRIVETNKQAEALLGRSREEIIGMHQSELHPAEKAEEYRHRFVTHIEKGHAADYDGEVITKDGSIVPVAISAASLTIGGKRLILGLFRDVTERKRAEEAVQEAERRYKAIFDNRLQMVYINNEQGLFLDANDYALERLGYTRDDLRKVSLQDILHPDDLPKVLENVADVFVKGFMEHPVELRVITKSGETIWLETFGVPVERGVDHFIGLGIAQDITARKRAEEALQASERRYRLLAENVSDVIYLMDVDLRLTYVSPSVTPMLGYSAEEVMSGGLEEYLTPASLEVALQTLAKDQAIEGLRQEDRYRSWPLEMELRCKDGSTVWTETRVTYLRDADGQITGYLGAMRDITERKGAEEVLRRQEEYLRSLIENASDAINVLNADGTVRYASPSFEMLWGRKPEDMINISPYDNLHPDDIPKVADAFAQLLPNPGGTLHIEVRGQHKDGSWRNIEATAKNLLHDPVVEGVVVNIRDITERKRVEEALRESEARYRLLAENAADVILCTDMNMRTTYISPSVTRLLDYTPEEAMSRSLAESMTPASLEVATQAFAAGVATAGQDKEGVFRRRAVEVESYRKDGSTVWVEIMVSFVRDSEGEPIEVLCVMRDITERKRAEEALRQSEEKFRHLSEETSDGVAVIIGGRIYWANKAFSDMYGYTQEQLIGKDAAFLAAPEALPPLIEWAKARHAAKDVSPRYETVGKRRDGSTISVDVSATLMSFEGKQATLIATRDISDRKRLDAERERLLRELEDKTRELEQIVFVASHDLRSPLVNIQGFTRELEQSLEEVRSGLQSEDVPSVVREKLAVPLNEDIPDAFRYILASSAKIDSLLSGLLRLSRLGRAALTIDKLDMNGVMADVTQVFEFLVKETGATLEVEDLPPCHGDKTQINQVFSNLIDNALKFLQPSRAGIIRVSGWSEDGQAVYCVEDNGIGIAPEHQERVFEIFQRLDPSANSGEGLGLAIVRRILERHTGKAWIKSEPGKGSKFFVSLPTV